MEEVVLEQEQSPDTQNNDVDDKEMQPDRSVTPQSQMKNMDRSIFSSMTETEMECLFALKQSQIRPLTTKSFR